VLKDLHGATHDLARYRGKVVLVNFWATWCEPCRHEMPSMQRLRDKLAGKPFVVLAVNVDEPDARVRRFVEETRFNLPVVLDMNKTVTRAWKVRVMPTSYIVDTEGKLRYRVVGDIDWSTDTVIGTITQLLGGG
jgi:thiol-disulfide isomerase/thioredoxin